MKRSIDMTNGSLLGGALSYAIPIMLTSILQLLFNAADMIVVGRYCGSISVAAVSATGALTNLIVNLFIGLSVGAGVAVAHGLGSRNFEVVHRTIHTALPVALISGLFLTIVGVCFTDDFLWMMETPENVLPLSTKYMKIYFMGITFNMVYNFCTSILRAAGDTKGPLVYLTVAGIINVILNVVFVTVWDMNVAGVALATTISQGVSAVLVIIALIRRTDSCRLELRKMRIYMPQLLKIIRVGLPAGIQGSMFSISNVIIQSSINSFNSDAIMSGNGAAANIEGFVYVIMNAFHLTAVNYVGQNSGANRFDRVRKVYGVCILYATVFGFLSGFSAWYFGRPLLGIYITDSMEAIEYGLTRLSYVALYYFLCGMMDVSTGALRGLGVSVQPMIISILGVCVFRIAWIKTVFEMPQYHTPECLYISYIISWILTFLAQTVAFFLVYRKRQRAATQISQPSL